MPVRDLTTGERLGLDRGELAVCIPVYGAYDLFVQCLLSVVKHTPADETVLIADDGNADPRFRRITEEAADRDGREIAYLRQPENVGFVRNVNAAMAVAAPGDLVILNSDCVVSENWLSGLRDAAYSDARVATATALTNAGTIVSVPHRNRPITQLPPELTVDRAARAVRRTSLQLRPDVPTCIGHCVLIRRRAIDLVGELDETFSPGYEEEVDFSQRCVLRGLRHVVADDVFVLHRHAGSFGHSEATVARRRRHHDIIRQRYPYYDDWVRSAGSDRHSPLARSLLTASTALRPMRVTIDGRCLGPAVTGTQLVTLGVAAALDTHTDVELTVLVPEDLGPWARGFLHGRPSIRLLRPSEILDGAEPADIAHRPYQVASSGDLTLLTQLGERLVLSQLDNIALRNPGYFGSFAEWQRYQHLTELALAAADQVVFISRHAAQDAVELGLVAQERANVVHPATEQEALALNVEAEPPGRRRSLNDEPYLLCLGTDFLHKNRVFAFRLLLALQEDVGWRGRLVFAGPKVASGSSAGEEAAFLLQRPELRERVMDVGTVDERGKRWLLERAAAVLYPTTYEGFGLTPFEAADAGSPCLFAAHTSLAEVLSEATALLVPWDAQESARRVAPVLVPGPEREEHVRAIRLAGARFTISGAAAGLLETYRRALQEPPASAAAGRMAGAGFTSAPHGGANGSALASMAAGASPDLQRLLLAIEHRQPLRRSVLAMYRAARRLRRSPSRR